MAFSNALNYQDLAQAVAMDPKVKAEMWAKYLEVGSRAHDVFSMFESEQPRVPIANPGKAGIFSRKRDLSKNGGDKVNFTVISAPGGPGVIGERVLKGNESKAKFKTYSVTVDWHRDAVAFTKKQIAFMATGGVLEETTAELLKLKMGLWKQNDMMMALIHRGVGNTYRPNNKTSRDAIVSTDVLDISASVAAKARLNTLGAKPISHRMGDQGDKINGFLTFASEMAFLPIRNDAGYQNALQQADGRGDGNALFTGRLVQWQGQNFCEHIVTDQDWDDYVGSPIQPKAVMHSDVAGGTSVFTAGDSVVGDCVLKGSSVNTTNLYFQFFPGFDYEFTEDDSLGADTTLAYVWAINPDGTVAFLSYDGTNANDGNQITPVNILAPAAGTSTLGVISLGNLNAGATPTYDAGSSGTFVVGGGGDNLPAGFTYTDEVQTGAILVPANANGVPIFYGFVFGAHAACRAYGAVQMAGIEQDDDYSFQKGKGYEMVFGQAPTINTNQVTNGYLLLEFAGEHEGYPVPSL